MKRVIPAIVFIGLLLGMSGCKASEPGQLESSILKEVKKSVTIGGKDVKNPIAYSPEVAKSGQDHFGHHCQICHGYDGQNTGVPFATKMDPPVPELTSADVQEYADGQLKWIIENGIAPSGMPAWKGILDEDEMWQIVHYIRHLPPKGSLGVPEVYKEEAEEHEQTKNPGTKTHTHKDGKEHQH